MISHSGRWASYATRLRVAQETPWPIPWPDDCGAKGTFLDAFQISRYLDAASGTCLCDTGPPSNSVNLERIAMKRVLVTAAVAVPLALAPAVAFAGERTTSTTP